MPLPKAPPGFWLEKPKHVCRTCLREDENLTSVFIVERSLHITYSEIISSVTGLEIYPCDGISSYVCITCKQNAKLAYKYKMQALKTDEKLRNSIPNTTPEISCTKYKIETIYDVNLQEVNENVIKFCDNIKVEPTTTGGEDWKDEHGLPSKHDHVIPRKDEHVMHRKDNNVLPRKEEHVIPRKDEHVMPRKDDHVIPRQEVHVIPGKSGHILPRKDEHVLPRKDENLIPIIEEHVIPRKDEHMSPRKDEDLIPRKEEHVIPRKDEHILPRKDEHVMPKKDEHVLPRIDEDMMPRKNEHSMPRKHGNVLPRKDEHVIPRKVRNSKTVGMLKMKYISKHLEGIDCKGNTVSVKREKNNSDFDDDDLDQDFHPYNDDGSDEDFQPSSPLHPHEMDFMNDQCNYQGESLDNPIILLDQQNLTHNHFIAGTEKTEDITNSKDVKRSSDVNTSSGEVMKKTTVKAKPKPRRRKVKWSEETLWRALREIGRGRMGYKVASRTYKIPRTTLQRNLKIVKKYTNFKNGEMKENAVNLRFDSSDCLKGIPPDEHQSRMDNTANSDNIKQSTETKTTSVEKKKKIVGQRRGSNRWSPDTMQKVIQDLILGKIGFNSACRTYNIPRTTLKKYTRNNPDYINRKKKNIEEAVNFPCCGICSYTFFTQQDLHEHFVDHSKTMVIPCTLCDKPFLEVVYLKNHFLTEHKMTEEESSHVLADKVTNIEDLMTRQKQSSSNTNLHLSVCPQCGLVTVTAEDRDNHNDTEHPDTIHRCPRCYKVFNKELDLLMHRKVCLPKVRAECTVCKKKFARKNILAKHNMRHHPTPNTKPLELSFQCYICGKRFRLMEDLDKHKYRTHHPRNENGIMQCDTCDYKTIIQSRLVRHVLGHLRKWPSLWKLCTICGKNVSYSNLVVHTRRAHTHEKPYKCQYCDKTFVRDSDAKEHETTHTGDRPFKCKFCPKQFARRSTRRVHMRVHTGERPYKCSYCGQAFTQSQDMRRHERKHFGQTDYTCDVCGEGFKTITRLREHKMESQCIPF